MSYTKQKRTPKTYGDQVGDTLVCVWNEVGCRLECNSTSKVCVRLCNKTSLSLSLSLCIMRRAIDLNGVATIRTLQHTATHCNTLQHTATHCNTLQHTATHCNTLHHTSALLLSYDS